MARTPVSQLATAQAAHSTESGKSRGFVSGCVDFAQPQIFVVNEDGNTPDKRSLVESLGIQYLILQRTPHKLLPPCSTTDTRWVTQMPYRIDGAGGWMDQPFVSKQCLASVTILSIEPTTEFTDRSDMATRTCLPMGDAAQPTKVVCCYDSYYDKLSGTAEISGVQDAIGIL